jgi:hypothetical protein
MGATFKKVEIVIGAVDMLSFLYQMPETFTVFYVYVDMTTETIPQSTLERVISIVLRI